MRLQYKRCDVHIKTKIIFKNRKETKIMKKFFQRLKKKAENAAITAKVIIESKKAEGYIDTGVKIIIGVVIGGVILAGLYTLFNSTIMPTLSTEIGEMFNYGS